MDYKEYIASKLAELNLNDLEGVLDQSTVNGNAIFDNVTVEGLVESLIEGKPLFNTDVIIKNIMDLFIFEIKGSIILAVELVTICIVIGLLKSLSNSFGEKPVSNLGIIICSCFVIALCLKNFTYTYNLCSDTISTMTYTMQLLLPILIPLMIAIGGITSGGILNPVIMASITAFNTVLSKLILPAIYVSTIFILINGMTEKDYVNKLALFLRGVATFATGLCVTFFTGITVIQGFVTQSADGMLINTARYSISNFVPIVGGFAADSVDMVLSCIGIIKNGISILGVIILITLLIVPLIKLLAIAVVYKLTAIVTEPIGNKEISGCLNEMGNSVITMAVILFLTSMMFLIFVTVIISIGGGKL